MVLEFVLNIAAAKIPFEWHQLLASGTFVVINVENPKINHVNLFGFNAQVDDKQKPIAAAPLTKKRIGIFKAETSNCLFSVHFAVVHMAGSFWDLLDREKNVTFSILIAMLHGRNESNDVIFSNVN